MRKITYSTIGKSPQKIHEISLLDAVIMDLDGMSYSRVSIGGVDGEYLDIMGSSTRLVIGLGQKIANRISHFVLGLSKRDTEEVFLEDDWGRIYVKKNEVLALEDALLMGSCFWEGKEIPAAYNLRELEGKLF